MDRVVDAHREAPEVSVIIPTFNRAALLAETIDRLASVGDRFKGRWEVVVVDNNSTDHTARIVRSRQSGFPARLRYLFEAAQGRSHALNTGIASTTAPVLAFTDDDVLVSDDWIEAAARPLLERRADYTGGPVRPIWEAPTPRWLSRVRGDLWGTIAILDYGREPFSFEDRCLVPLGANMAVRRSLLERIGGFSGKLGRCGPRLLGQEVPEFLARSRAAGGRGLYVPAMIVDHHVPARRLTKSYFRRWWYGKGLSRAEMDRVQSVTELGVDLSKVPHMAGIPRFMLRTAAHDVAGWMLAGVRFDVEEQFRHEMMLCYFAGYAAARQRGSRRLRQAPAI